MPKLSHLILSATVAVLLAGCATAPKPEPSAGAAQGLIAGRPDEVAAALISEMTQRQFTVSARASGYLAFDRPIDNAALWPKLAGSPECLPRAHVAVTLTPVGDATRVAAEMTVIAEPGTPREHMVSMASLGVDPRMGEILKGASETLIADRGSSDPRVAFATARIHY
jgi:hypothetical protein